MAQNKVVLGLSGGPDSMFLLQRLIREKKEVICAHVNYYLRDESDEDQKLVERYCNDNQIKLYIKKVSNEDWKQYSYLKNKQSIAREIRYDFYLEIAQENNCKDIYIAHHKDDFIETALMQEKKSKDYLFYGLKESNDYKGFVLRRPLLNLYKSDIISFMNTNKIDFAEDKTNSLPLYTRNIVRSKLKNKNIEEKEKIYNYFMDINNSKENFRREVREFYNLWKNGEYSWESFNKIDESYKRYVLYNFFINWNTRINISGSKLNAVIDFLKTKKGNKEYRLMKNIYLIINKGTITLINK